MENGLGSSGGHVSRAALERLAGRGRRVPSRPAPQCAALAMAFTAARFSSSAPELCRRLFRRHVLQPALADLGRRRCGAGDRAEWRVGSQDGGSIERAPGSAQRAAGPARFGVRGGAHLPDRSAGVDQIGGD